MAGVPPITGSMIFGNSGSIQKINTALSVIAAEKAMEIHNLAIIGATAVVTGGSCGVAAWF